MFALGRNSRTCSEEWKPPNRPPQGVWVSTFRRKIATRRVAPVTVFLLESYLGTVGEPDLVELASRLSSAAESVSREGEPVRYLHSTYVPMDETCLHFVEASSAAAAERFARHAALSFDRVLEARTAVAIESEVEEER